MRYLDYCSELLSLISKIGAIYVQEFPDTVALQAVDQLASLSNDLSRGILQKIMIVENVRKSASVQAARQESPRDEPLGA